MTITHYTVSLRYLSNGRWVTKRFDSFPKAVAEAERIGLTECVIRAVAVYNSPKIT